MKRILIPLIILSFTITLGCLDDVDEMLDPDLIMIVEKTWTQNETEEGMVPLSDHEWFFVRINITNNNKDGSHPLDVYQFFARAEDKWLWCRGPPEDEIVVGPEDTVELTIYFEVGSGEKPTELEYRRTVSDPISCMIPA